MVNLLSPSPNGMKVRTMAKAQPLSKLTEGLSNTLNRPVLDKTGLGGRYDFSLEFANPSVPPPFSKGPDRCWPVQALSLAKQVRIWQPRSSSSSA